MQFVERIIGEFPTFFNNGGQRSDGFGGSFSDKWGWYQSIYTVAGGSIHEFEKTTELDIHTFLTFLSFKVELANESERQIAAQNSNQ